MCDGSPLWCINPLALKVTQYRRLSSGLGDSPFRYKHPWGVRSRGGITLGPCDSWVDAGQADDAVRLPEAKSPFLGRQRILEQLKKNRTAKSGPPFGSRPRLGRTTERVPHLTLDLRC
jgi:hypothetical protein